MNLAVAVSLEAVYIHTHSVHLKKTSIFPYTLLNVYARDG